MDWFIRLEESRDSLTRLERNLLDYVNENPEKAALLSQKEFARLADVSKPVLISLFRKLGYSDYRSFQAGVEQFFSSHIDSYRAAQALQERVHTLGELLDQAIDVDVRSLERVRSTVSEEILQTFVRTVTGGGTVYVAGAGTGLYPAHYLAQRLRRYRIVSILLSQDSTHGPDEFFPADRHDSVVVFQYAQDDRWLFPILRYARERGVTSFLISATIHPAYVGSCDHFLHIPRGEVRFKNSMAVPMTYANILLLAIEMVCGEEARNRLHTLEMTRGSWGNDTRQGGYDA